MSNTMTTNPPPPLTGMTSTNVPLSIDSQLDKQAIPQNILIQDVPSSFRKPNILVHDFDVNSGMAPGFLLYSWDSVFPLDDSIFTYANRTALSVGTPFVPWSLVEAYFSRKCSIEWTMILTPIKVPDSRCSFDVVFRYRDVNAPYGTNVLNNHTMHFLVDSQSKPIKFKIPQFWATQSVETMMGEIATHTFPPIGLPNTRISVYLSGQYQPSLLQPEAFKVLVELEPHVTNIETIAGRTSSGISIQAPGTPLAWFQRK